MRCILEPWCKTAIALFPTKSSKSVKLPQSEWIKIPNMHEPIIDIDLWNRVQALIKSRTKPASDTSKIGRFAKKTRCMYCGYFMRSQKSHGDRYLRRITSHTLKNACVGSSVSEKTLEKAILHALKKMIDEYDIQSEIESRIVYKSHILAK